jgi:cytochrome o ubiquinol oxidase subunit 2
MFSGGGFSDMRFVAKAVPAGDFDAWVKEVRGKGPALDNDRYAQLAKPSTAVPPATYRSVEPKLFDRIIEQTLSGPGKARVGAAWCPPGTQVGG